MPINNRLSFFDKMVCHKAWKKMFYNKIGPNEFQKKYFQFCKFSANKGHPPNFKYNNNKPENNCK